MADGKQQRSAAPIPVRRSAHCEREIGPLSASFYDRGADVVARDLLGMRLVSTVEELCCSGVIVETEAYVGPDDEASHAHVRFGRTARNSMMFGPAGAAYVYRIYGIHWCLNAVTGPEGFPAAVLIRALRPLSGIDTARVRRPGRADRDLMRGPGNLCRAMAVTGALNGHLLADWPLWIEPGTAVPDSEVQRGPRIGITRAVDLPLRFWIRGDPCVSR